MRAEDLTPCLPMMLEFDPAAVLAGLPVGIVLADAGGRVGWANATAGELLGVDAETLIGLDVAALPARRRLLLSKTTTKIRVVSRSGQTRWVECVTQRAAIAGYAQVVCLMDVTIYEQRIRRVTEIGADRVRDQLDLATGLLNRAAMLQELDAQVARSRRYRNPLSVLMLRIVDGMRSADGITRFDKHRPLRVVARMLREKLRWVDIAGLWSANEFLLVLPETSDEAAGHLARKLRSYLETLNEAQPEVFDARRLLLGHTQWQPGEEGRLLVERVAVQLEETVPAMAGRIVVA